MPFLSLPAEIHRYVSQLMLEEAVIHIKNASETRWHQTNPGRCPYSTFNRDQSMLKSVTRTKNLAALSMTCRQLRYELQTDLSRYPLLVFSGVESFDNFLNTKSLHGNIQLFDVRKLTKVHLDIGPGKHTELYNWTAVKKTLTLLVREAASLKVLSLSVKYYFGADADTIPLSDDVLFLLLGFTRLREVNVFMYDRPLGPVGGSHGPEAAISIDERLGYLSQALISSERSKQPVQSLCLRGSEELLESIKQEVKNKIQQEIKCLKRLN